MTGWCVDVTERALTKALGVRLNVRNRKTPRVDEGMAKTLDLFGGDL
jgi:hypothetical protein